MNENRKQTPNQKYESAVPSEPEFWRGYRVERVGGNVYLSNEAGTECFTLDTAEAYALAILAEVYQDDPNA